MVGLRRNSRPSMIPRLMYYFCVSQQRSINNIFTIMRLLSSHAFYEYHSASIFPLTNPNSVQVVPANPAKFLLFLEFVAKPTPSNATSRQDRICNFVGLSAVNGRCRLVTVMPFRNHYVHWHSFVSVILTRDVY